MDSKCEMKGFLNFLMLWLLSNKPMSGQELASEIKKRRGSKPSPGTIYPVLKDLRLKGLITQSDSNSKNKVYHLTATGRRELRRQCQVFCRIFYDLKEEIVTFEKAA